MTYSIEWPHPVPDRRGFAEPQSRDEELCDALVVNTQRTYRHFKVTVNFAAEAPEPTVRIEIFLNRIERFFAWAGQPDLVMLDQLPGRYFIDGLPVYGLRLKTEIKSEPVLEGAPFWRRWLA